MIEIVYSTSDSYSICTGVSIYSLFENNRDLDVRVHVILNEVSKENIERIKEIGRKFNKQIDIIDNSEYLDKFGEEYNLPKVRGSYSTYFRLNLHNLLPSYDKVLVIDSDTLVVGSIKKLFEKQLDNYLMLAVPEAAVYSEFQDIEDADLLKGDRVYYNMGIVLINLKKWRENHIDEYLKKELKNNKHVFRVADQSIINRFLSNNIGCIELKYNFYSPAHGTNYKCFTNLFNKRVCFSENEFNEAQKNPVIIHFFGHSFERPWFKKNSSYYKNEYMKYLNKLNWRCFLKSKWIKTKRIFKVYDYVCYLLLKTKKNDLALVFRYKYGQKMKKYLGVKR